MSENEHNPYGSRQTETPMPPSVNFHLWQPCNMRCSFCFARFEDVREVLPPGHLKQDEAIALTRALAGRFDKITFAGGEPTLCPWLPALIVEAKHGGATTMLVTNGTRITEAYLAALAGALDWVTLSVDSARPEVNVALGRAVNGQALSSADYIERARLVRGVGMRLKVNTVVTALNVDEDLRTLLTELNPEHWKPLQVLPVGGQNDGHVEALLISKEQFRVFVERHRAVEARGAVVRAEDNDDMTGSYAMVDPAGRFFDNTSGRHTYSSPILAFGVDSAWAAIRFSIEKFSARGGLYPWRTA